MDNKHQDKDKVRKLSVNQRWLRALTQKKKLEHINTLDKEGLKGYYKELIKSSEISDKGGAGLGFVDIARKSGQKLEFDFEKVNEEYSFFSFKTKISKETE